MIYTIIIIFHFLFPDLDTTVLSITLKILKLLENNTFWLSFLSGEFTTCIIFRNKF